MNRPGLLVIEDDADIRTQMKWALVQDYDIYLANESAKALEILERVRPPLVTLDLSLPPHTDGPDVGLELLEKILRFDPTTKVIVITGNPDRNSALQAISLGAHDFFIKPIDIDELKAILKRAYYVNTLENEYRALQKELHRRAFGDIIGNCPKMQEVFETVRKVATTDVPVLITGESGTGKELIAKAIHGQSLRSEKPFIPINCGAIPETLMESELFGHERGAFTGAYTRRKGRIELASGGTLFLDEVGELPLSLQVKILRFLQDHRIERIGGRESLEIDVRVIAATNRDLKALIEEGKFREDLYYRLAVVTIELPPLRERGEDIELLARTALQKFGGANGPKHLSPGAIEALNSYHWPGNVRELENRLRRAIALAEGPTITSRDIGFGDEETARTQSLDLKRAREALDKRFINMAITKHRGNISKAARDLGISRPTLHYLLKKYNIPSGREPI